MKRWIKSWNTYWFPETSTLSLAVCRIVVVATQLLLFFPSVEQNINLLHKGTGFISPQFLIAAISAIVPNDLLLTETGFAVVRWVTVVAGITCLIGILTRASAFAFALGNWILIAHRYSYGDIHHPESVFCIFLMLLAFSPSGEHLSIDALIRRRREGVDKKDKRASEMVDTAAWPLKLAHVLLALTYFSTGLSKMIYGGLQWMNGHTLQIYLLYDAIRREIPLGIWLAQQHTLCILLSVGTILFELFFFLSLIVPRTVPYFMIGGIFFQIGLYVVVGHHFFQHMILLGLLLVFNDVERAKGWWEMVKLFLIGRSAKLAGG